MERHTWILVALVALYLASPATAGAEGFWSKFIDKEPSGIDIAQGPEDTVVYLQFGHAW